MPLVACEMECTSMPLLIQLIIAGIDTIVAVLQVTCHQLGFSLAVAVATDSHYGGGGAGVRVWLENVNCEGGESDIVDCVAAGDWGVVSTDCEDHTHDAGVICAGTFLALTLHHLPCSVLLTPHLPITPHLPLLIYHSSSSLLCSVLVPQLSLLTYHPPPITLHLPLLTYHPPPLPPPPPITPHLPLLPYHSPPITSHLPLLTQYHSSPINPHLSLFTYHSSQMTLRL